jgi:DNA-binding transcriptional MerR regulator
MRIGQLAKEVGISADTVRFYERAGSLPRAPRRENAYREYDDADVEHLRLLIDLRRLEIPLERAALIASWCHSGHCADMNAALPGLIAEQRAAIRRRMASLVALDERLANLEQHLVRARPALNVLVDGAPCCDAAAAVVSSVEGGCACCATTGIQREN